MGMSSNGSASQSLIFSKMSPVVPRDKSLGACLCSMVSRGAAFLNKRDPLCGNNPREMLPEQPSCTTKQCFARRFGVECGGAHGLASNTRPRRCNVCGPRHGIERSILQCKCGRRTSGDLGAKLRRRFRAQAGCVHTRELISNRRTGRGRLAPANSKTT